MPENDGSYSEQNASGAQCILWDGATYPTGYGRLYREGRTRYAHRDAYERAHGPIPRGMVVMHTCDTPACVNPDHLKLGTQADNLADMYAKGRGRKANGADHGLAVLTAEKAIAIYRDPRPKLRIAREYGIGCTTVGDIKKGRCWSHVTGHKAA